MNNNLGMKYVSMLDYILTFSTMYLIFYVWTLPNPMPRNSSGMWTNYRNIETCLQILNHNVFTTFKLSLFMYNNLVIKDTMIGNEYLLIYCGKNCSKNIPSC